MTFYYPFTGLINLFVHILKYPGLPSAPSDVALMDIVAGHFGRVEYLTASHLAFPFIREITSLANKMVKKARSGMQEELALPVPQMATSTSLMDEPMSSFGVGNFTNVSCLSFISVHCTTPANKSSFQIWTGWDLIWKIGPRCHRCRQQGYSADLIKEFIIRYLPSIIHINW